MCLLVILLLLLLFIQFPLLICYNLSFIDSTCSLTFRIQRYDNSSRIQIEFPIEFIANYNFTCKIANTKYFYKIIPLEILTINSNNTAKESIESMIEVNATQFHFYINQSSTVQLCVSTSSVLSIHNLNDNHQICRQIHIGISNLHHFWNLPMKIFYLFSMSSIVTYYILFFLQGIWQRGWKKPIPKSKSLSSKQFSIIETNNDTFENEKVNEEDASDDEEE